MEHKLIQGGEMYLPFARKQIKRLRATGLRYATQRYTMPDGEVMVKIAGDQEYIVLKGPAPAKFYVLLTATCNSGGNWTTAGSYARNLHSMLIGFDGVSLNKGRYKVLSSASGIAALVSSGQGVDGSYDRMTDLSSHATVLRDICPTGKKLAKYYSSSVLHETQVFFGGDGQQYSPTEHSGSTATSTKNTTARITFYGFDQTFERTESQTSSSTPWGLGNPTVNTSSQSNSGALPAVNTANGYLFASFASKELCVAISGYGAPNPQKKISANAEGDMVLTDDPDQNPPATFIRTPNTPVGDDPFVYMSGIHTSTDYPLPAETTNYAAGYHGIVLGTSGSPSFTRRQAGTPRQGWNWIQRTVDTPPYYSFVFRDRALNGVPPGATNADIVAGNYAKQLRLGSGAVAVSKDQHLRIKYATPLNKLQLVDMTGVLNNYDYGTNNANYIETIVSEVDLTLIPEVAAHPVFSVALSGGASPTYTQDGTMSFGFYDNSTGTQLVGTLYLKIAPDAEALMDPTTSWYDPVKDA